MRILIIADDLTGALDSAAALADAGLSCRVARRPRDIPVALAGKPDVIAVSTASREGNAAAARAAVAAVFDALSLAEPAIVFKKIDSRLKGHLAAELSIVAARTGIGRALVAPAIPKQGRIAEGGHLSGTGVAVPIEIAACLGDTGLELVIPETRTDADLDRALAAVLAGPPVLLVGAAGLAAALARRLGDGSVRIREALPPSLLLAIGSRDPITLAQVDALRATGLADEMVAPGGRLDGSGAAWRGHRPGLVRLVSGGSETDPGELGAHFASTIAGLFSSGEIGTLFGCGGETADAILGELGIGVLRVEGELLPGVPVSQMVVNGRPVKLVTKSGGFGVVDTLISVVEGVDACDKDAG